MTWMKLEYHTSSITDMLQLYMRSSPELPVWELCCGAHWIHDHIKSLQIPFIHLALFPSLLLHNLGNKSYNEQVSTTFLPWEQVLKYDILWICCISFLMHYQNILQHIQSGQDTTDSGRTIMIMIASLDQTRKRLDWKKTRLQVQSIAVAGGCSCGCLESGRSKRPGATSCNWSF